jgi:hypothetical protein
VGNSVKRSLRRVVGWLNVHHVALVITLSLFHIGLSCIHVRDSGGSDSVDIATRLVRIPLIVIAGSGIVITDSADHDHAVGAKRR